MGALVPIAAVDVAGAAVSAGVAAAGVGWVAGQIGQALQPQQAKVAALKADAEARVRNSGVPPVTLRP